MAVLIGYEGLTDKTFLGETFETVRDRYALICREYDKTKASPPYLSAKIKEYGELLSDTPFMQLLELIDPEAR